MERKNRNPIAVPSLEDKAKENNQTQSYDILDPNVFQNISKCFPKLPAEAFTARLRLHQSLRHWVRHHDALQRVPRRWLVMTFPMIYLPKHTQDPCAENIALQRKTASGFSTGHLPTWRSSTSTWTFRKRESMNACGQMSSPSQQAFEFIPSTLGNHSSASNPLELWK